MLMDLEVGITAGGWFSPCDDDNSVKDAEALSACCFDGRSDRVDGTAGRRIWQPINFSSMNSSSHEGENGRELSALDAR